MVSTLLWAFAEKMRGTALPAAPDAFWPLSMLGLAAIGVRIAVAGHRRGAARFWLMVAESWAPIVVPISRCSCPAWGRPWVPGTSSSGTRPWASSWRCGPG